MKTLMTLLENSTFSYELMYHEKPIISAEDGAGYFGIDKGQTAPTLIVKADKDFFALIVSGSRGRVNIKKIADILKCNKIRMCSREEAQNATGFDVGSIPFIGLSIPCIIDKHLFHYPFVYGGTGKSTYTLKIEPQALCELNTVAAMFDYL
ncbi:aminoacyl-tRNA deacylase [Bacillus chungangensis]|uniref:Prolyl-tRNA editing enzyme YbaK/EbsC (Cys-tRNA(Pro) deacylase) n=1 Tax=Bacillus chungangensis TaxID=587633 RepID=A0ABT9WYG2_9BACI|nr:YbaK/EbsC family protein [Bacillus chungangensis]MDQ0178257.1 prolyl-tRNA editing enzyme YbaK/EbsC (Cys-tRNA(Pro) deacylase) [Bacillus chungangensis]